MNEWILNIREQMAPDAAGGLTPQRRLRMWPPTNKPATTARAGPTFAVRACSSLICEWREHRDAGAIEGKGSDDKVGKLTAEPAHMVELRRELAKENKRLSTTSAARKRT